MSSVVYFEIQAGNPQRAIDFYVNVFGWDLKQWDDQEYWLVTTRSASSLQAESSAGIDGAIMLRRGEAPVDGQAVNAYVCTIGVENIDEALEKIKEHGGQQMVEKQAIPEVGTYAYCKDTEGNIFGVMQSAMKQ